MRPSCFSVASTAGAGLKILTTRIRRVSSSRAISSAAVIAAVTSSACAGCDGDIVASSTWPTVRAILRKRSSSSGSACASDESCAVSFGSSLSSSATSLFYHVRCATMRRLVRIVGWIIAVLLITLGVLWATLRHAPTPTTPGPDAEALAHDLVRAVDGDAWGRTGAIRWNVQNRRHLWDRQRSLARVEWGKHRVLLETGS